jgi:hypothetical protein
MEEVLSPKKERAAGARQKMRRPAFTNPAAKFTARLLYSEMPIKSLHSFSFRN